MFAAVVLMAAHLPVLLQAGGAYSVSCGGGTACTLSEGVVPGSEASGRFFDEVNETGWGRLFIKTSSTHAAAAHAAGYLEGALTAKRFTQHLNNYKSYYKLEPLPQEVRTFVEASDAWTREQITRSGSADTYWDNVGFIYAQLDGLLQGANDHLDPTERLSRMDLLLLNLQGDMEDVLQAARVTARPNFTSMSLLELNAWQRQRSHCSALVKLVPDGSELFTGHNMWWSYYAMLRVFKRYEFGTKPTVAMSSYPGILASTDDFYQVENLVVMEATLPDWNAALLEAVSPRPLPCWIRAMTSSYLAKSGPDWMRTFSMHNSGTYNNMWMVVDYSKFTPGRPLPEGVLTVGEQLPGYFYFEDQSRVLSYGYWPSYNKAVYPETQRSVRQDVMAKERGPSFSHEFDVRAQIFRRDQGRVSSDEDMQRILRYNNFQKDPLARGSPNDQLAARGDLGNTSATAAFFGAVDGKYTSFAHVRAQKVVVVSGPTHDDQPVFDWSRTSTLATMVSHVGQPDRFDFDWVVMGPDMHGAARPWHTGVSGVPPPTVWPLCLVAALLSSAMLAYMARKRLHSNTLEPRSGVAKALLDDALLGA
mmetsp:Transcript_26334/g.73628  ORF Transcript_26334/g.73628 Transcript_26334/m.73628 type:complete len:590 (-) Transcript_26334:224-1993(-)